MPSDINALRAAAQAATDDYNSKSSTFSQKLQMAQMLKDQYDGLQAECSAGHSSACSAAATLQPTMQEAIKDMVDAKAIARNALANMNDANATLQAAIDGTNKTISVPGGVSADKMVIAAETSPSISSPNFITSDTASLPSPVQDAPSITQKSTEMLDKVTSTGKVPDLKGLVSNALPTNIVNTSNTVAKQITATSTPPSGSSKVSGKDLRIKLVSRVTPSDMVVFAITPTVTEDRQAQYASSDLLHHPGQMQIYRSTSARTWSIQGMFVSRTADEAQFNQDMVNLIRSWTMPYFGTGTEAEQQQNESGSRFGAPPDVLTLSGYGESMIGPSPVVLTNSGFTWNNDIQYIQTSRTLTPFPIILQVSLSLTESYSTSQYSKFSLADYKKGLLDKAFP